MLLIRDDVIREGSRRGLALNKYSISKDVIAGCEVDVDLDYESKTFKVSKIDDRAENDTSDMEVIAIADKFAITSNVPCKVNIVVLGSYMYIELIQGGMIIENPQDGSPMFIYRNIDVSTLGGISDYIWLNTKNMNDYFNVWSKFANDIMFQVEVSVKASKGSPMKVVKLVDKYDISNGMIDQEIRTQEELQKSRTLQRMFSGKPAHESETLAEIYKDMADDDKDYEIDYEDEDDYDDYDEDEDLVEGIDY